MKTLLIMRHAKSSWKQEGQPDHDRPLNDRGKRDAPRMGRLLARQGLRPDRILCSSAKRARRTAEGLAGPLDCAGAIELRDDLYAAGPNAYLDALRALPPEVRTAMVIGHDPALSELVCALAGEALEMPTAAIACFSLNLLTWDALAMDTPREMHGLWLPRELPASEP
ncbi:MAG: histidine phosphatase family protein [Candidatus Hydrogenedentes bacterium]|nr:histidine phosphatase family protein [Candidatus Hydrogenedentota bacterium]